VREPGSRRARLFIVPHALFGDLLPPYARFVAHCTPTEPQYNLDAVAGYMQVLDFAVLSQVMPRLVGLSLYRLDINFRESAVIGIVGAGGIGATLNTAMDRYEFDSAAAIILVIITIVMVAEYSSGWLRKRIQ
jgi:ABC-type phosphate/phosphonate transport system permease subunit